MLFFFNDTATTEIYTLSLHDALPISMSRKFMKNYTVMRNLMNNPKSPLDITLHLLPSLNEHDLKLLTTNKNIRSEEHTSELQSQSNLVCRLLLEKKTSKESKMGTVMR